MSSQSTVPYGFSSKSAILLSTGNYSTALHNYLQERREVHLLSWAESASTLPDLMQWTVQCKIGGEVKGTGVGVQKATAKQAAAKQACEALSIIPV
ncbi:hypothetical protein L208DRAFT_422529 [Tricholoma matsutake]|nr:hypothetical protein L208DRAFT_422529 [Tricholoma matsutake 945]